VLPADGPDHGSKGWRVLAANPKFMIGNWRKTQFRNDMAQLEADVAALEAGGLADYPRENARGLVAG
jgi:hypothetical protein